MQMGRFVAGVIRREVAAKAAASPRGARAIALPARPAFAYHDKGSMATIGRAKAVAEVAGLKLSGVIAWLAWLFVHLIQLAGFHNRVLVFLSWGFAYVTFSKGSRIISGDPPSHVAQPIGARCGNTPQERRRAIAELLRRCES
jgi:NADH dehydrogenase